MTLMSLAINVLDSGRSFILEVIWNEEKWRIRGYQVPY